MNNKAMVLVLALFIILVLGVLSSSFLFKQTNQSFLSNRYADGIRALWIAEGGLQAARNDNLTQSSISGNMGAGSYAVDIAQIGSSSYYEVISTGTVGGVSRTIEAVVSTRDVNATRFRYGIESTVDIDFKGASTVWGENTTPPLPPAHGTYDDNYYKENSVFSFADLFAFSSAEIKDLSTVYTDDFPDPGFSGVNWVDDPDAHYNGDIDGSGILIINGSVRITGTIDFSGIIYVIGELTMAGTSYVNGTILAESAANVDTTVTGTADIEHNTTNIQMALDEIKYRSPQVVSWKELVP